MEQQEPRKEEITQEKQEAEKNHKEPQHNTMIRKTNTLKEEPKEGHLSTFTKTVAVIRPDNFAKNVEATEDNKFMKDANMENEELILQVSSRILSLSKGPEGVRKLHANANCGGYQRGRVFCEGRVDA